MSSKPVNAVLDDESLSQKDKIAELQQMYADTRALQRAATESPMGEGEADLGARLRQIELALQEFGIDADEQHENNAASL